MLGQIRPAALHYAPSYEDVDVVGSDVLEQSLVVRDDEEGPVGAGEPFHPFGNGAQGIDVES